MKWYLKALGKYFVFSGRARRKEFWIYVLFTFIFYVVVFTVDDLIDSESFFEKLGFDGHMLPAINILTIYFLIILIPSLAVSVRRLHDIGKSAWILLIAVIPIVGQIWLLVLMAIDSNSGENQYGLNPKGLGNFDQSTIVQKEQLNIPSKKIENGQKINNKIATTIFGFFTLTEGDALVISISDPEKWKKTLRTRMGLAGADVILFEERDWLMPEIKSKSIDELKTKYSLIISTIKKKILSYGVPVYIADEVMKKAEIIPNPISGLVVFIVVYSGILINSNS